MNHTNQFPAASRPLTSTQPSRQSLWIPAKKVSKALLSGLIAMMTLLAGHDLMATTYFSKGATGDPTLLTAWTNSAGANPADFTSGDTFVIQNGHTYTCSQNWTVSGGATVQINATGILALDNGTTSYNLNLGGNLVQNNTSGGITTSTSRGSSIVFTSNGSWTGSGDMSYSTAKINVTINAGVVLTATNVTTGFKLKTGNTITWTCNGTLDMGTRTFNGNASANNATFVLGASGTLICAHTGGLGAITGSSATGTFFNFTATSKVTLPTTANYTFNGAAAQITSVSLPATVNNLTNNNSAGLTLSQAMTVNGTLALNSGIVKSNVTLGASATISGGSSTAYLNGQLTVPFTTPSSMSYTFPIGTASAYSPISLANLSDASGGTLTASATAATPSNLGSSGIDGSLYIARYWTLTGSGFTSPTYDFTGTYVAGDIQNGADPANLIVRKWDGSSWSAPASSSSVAYTVTGNGFTTSFGQFAAGQAQTTIPVLDSTTKTGITNTSAILGATLENNFSLPISDYGIVWGTLPNPTTANNKVQVGTSTPTLGNPFTANVTGLPVATTIYYRGYAINSSSQTGYSTNGSFLTLTNEPTIQASAAGVSALQNGNLSVTWTRGNGAKCIVLVSAGSPVDAPVDGSTYTANAAFAIGSPVGASYVAYLGTGTNVTLTGLSSSTTYYVAVYELNGAGGSENYLTVSPATGSQTTVATPVSTITWTGTVDTDWNKTGNWDASLVPDVGTAVVIPVAPANQPVYSNQMTEASVGILTVAGTLTVNTNGFNSGALTLNNVAESGAGTGAKMSVGSGGVVNVSGAVALTSNAWLTVASGGSLTASGALTIGSSGSSVGSCGIVTNSGGTINVTSTTLNSGNASLSSSTATSGNCLFVISGGTNTLGSVSVGRSTTSSGFNNVGKEGLVIYGGQVTMSGLNVGGGNANSALSTVIAGGVVTNNGSVFINQVSVGRGSRLLQTGGLFVVTNLVNPNPTVAGSTNIYAVTGGTNIVSGFAFGSGSGAGLVYFTNSANIYVGSQGMVSNGVVVLAAAMNDGALFGATTDWTGSAAMNLAIGTETFKTADLGGTPHNITYNGVLTGAGALNVTGGGILTLGAADTYSGSTLISGGTLALGASGSLTSPQIILASGTTFDVSALGGAYSPTAAQTLSGFGNISGLVTATTGSIQPGSNSVTGTLTFGGGLSESGGVTNNFVLPGDKIAVGSGTALSVSGANVVQIAGAVSAGADYTLFDYSGGSFSGSVASFTLTGAGVNGYLTNDVTAQAIKFHALSSLRAPTTIAWVGNSSANNWDAGVTTNWLNAGALDDFLTGDTAVFGDLGGVNPYVNIAGSVSPTLVVVNTSSNYVFAGTGSIIGSGGITVSNGSLTIATTNSYTGPTVLAGGVLVISNIANGTFPSPIGAAPVAAANVVFNGGTLNYFGPTAATDHGITLTNGGGVIDVAAGATLTLNGSIIGNGGLTKIDTGSLTLATGNSYSGNTVVSNGVLTLNDPAAAGSGSINLYGGNLKLGAVKPNNTVNVAGNAQVTGGNSGGATGVKNVTGGSNLVVSVTSGVFDLAGEMSAYSGTITLSNAGGATVRFNGSASSVGSALATWDLGVGTMDLNVRVSSTSNNIGALQGGSTTTLSGRGGSGNSGATTYYIGANNLNTTFDGVIQNGFGASGSVPSGTSPTSINKVGSGTLTLNGVSTFTGTAVVSGGTLSGTGTISGATTFNANTILSAGINSVGTLTFSGDLTLDVTSTNAFAVTTAGGASNSVTVAGTLYPNTSVIHITSGTSLAVGTYTLFNYTGISGSFNATPVFDVVPAAAASIVDNGSGKINLQVGSAAPPRFSSITTSGSDITLQAAGGTSGGPVTVLSTTNLTLPFAQWSSVTTGNFDGSGNFSYTVTGALSSGQPQEFYILQTP